MRLDHIGAGLGNLYNTGLAHGHPRFRSVEEFTENLLKLCKEQPSIVGIISFTNNVQDAERRYMLEIGFSCQKYRNILMHYIDVKNIGNLSEEYIQAQKEAKKEAARLAAEALAARRAKYRYNAEGRRLNANGTIFRHPYELFVGDTIRIHGLYNYHKEMVVESIEEVPFRHWEYRIKGTRINKAEYILTKRIK